MRNDSIDILRFIGLAMIIFAHVNPPEILHNLRNFDVPLMVLVAGMSFGLSYKANESYAAYIWKRIKRLVFPVWIFLTLFFIGQFIINPSSPGLDLTTIVGSYTLYDGIGYVWIIRIFLLVAIASPILLYFHKKIERDRDYFLMLSIGLLLYEGLRYLLLPYIQDGFGIIASSIVLYTIPYALVFSAGLRILAMKPVQLYVLCLISFLSFIVIGVALYMYSGYFISTQEFKYPPSTYYISYAIFVSVSLWLSINVISLVFEKLRVKSIVLFIANNTIWIYLWHIPLLMMINQNFVIKYLVVFSGAVAITHLQTLLVRHFLLKRAKNEQVKKNIKMILMG